MTKINNIPDSPTTPIQHEPNQASTPARLVIRTADQARDHWRTTTPITSRSQASDAMAELQRQSDVDSIDEWTYRLLGNALRDIHNSLQEREITQEQRAHMPVRPPTPGWQASARVSVETLAMAVTAIQQGASIEQAERQLGVLDSADLMHLRAAFRQQTPRVSVETLATAVAAIQQGASVEEVAQQHGIRGRADMIHLNTAFNNRR